MPGRLLLSVMLALSRADAALYRTKKEGRNRAVPAQPAALSELEAR